MKTRLNPYQTAPESINALRAVETQLQASSLENR